MPYTTKHESGAIIFNLTDDEKAVKEITKDLKTELEEVRLLKEELKKLVEDNKE